jgi:hypothetical protein
LKIEVSDEALKLPGLRVERDGVEVGRAVFGAAIPVDGGGHVITASAPGYKPWTSSVRVGSESDILTVAVPNLTAEPVAAPASASSAVDAPPKSGLTGLQLAGIVTGGVGVAALGVGGYFSLKAVDRKDESDAAGCDGQRCPPEGAELRREAVTMADRATLFVASGAVLSGAAITLFFVGRRREAPAEARRVELRVLPGGALVTGVF